MPDLNPQPPESVALKTFMLASTLLFLTASCTFSESTAPEFDDSSLIEVIAEFGSESATLSAMTLIHELDDGSQVVSVSDLEFNAVLTPDAFALVVKLPKLLSIRDAADADGNRAKNPGCFLEYVDCVSGEYYGCHDSYLTCMEP